MANLAEYKYAVELDKTLAGRTYRAKGDKHNGLFVRLNASSDTKTGYRFAALPAYDVHTLTKAHDHVFDSTPTLAGLRQDLQTEMADIKHTCQVDEHKGYAVGIRKHGSNGYLRFWITYRCRPCGYEWAIQYDEESKNGTRRDKDIYKALCSLGQALSIWDVCGSSLTLEDTLGGYGEAGREYKLDHEQRKLEATMEHYKLNHGPWPEWDDDDDEEN